MRGCRSAGTPGRRLPYSVDRSVKPTDRQAVPTYTIRRGCESAARLVLSLELGLVVLTLERGRAQLAHRPCESSRGKLQPIPIHPVAGPSAVGGEIPHERGAGTEAQQPMIAVHFLISSVTLPTSHFTARLRYFLTFRAIRYS